MVVCLNRFRTRASSPSLDQAGHPLAADALLLLERVLVNPRAAVALPYSHQTTPAQAPRAGDPGWRAPTLVVCTTRRIRSASPPTIDRASGQGSAPSPPGSTRTSQ